MLDVVFVAEATVHPRTDQHSGWTAMTCLASVNDRLADGFDLDADSVATIRTLAGKIYGSGPTEIRDVDVAEHAVDGHGGVRLTAQVHYQIDGLPSRYDDLTAILVRLDDGSVVAALSSVPDDASDADPRTLAAEVTEISPRGSHARADLRSRTSTISVVAATHACELGLAGARCRWPTGPGPERSASWVSSSSASGPSYATSAAAAFSVTMSRTGPVPPVEQIADDWRR